MGPFLFKTVGSLNFSSYLYTMIMTKKEIKKIQLKAIIKAVKENFDVVQDFEDFEGHGYFDFSIDLLGKEMQFMMHRRDFEVMGYDVKGDDFYKESQILEGELNSLVDVTLAKLEEEGITA